MEDQELIAGSYANNATLANTVLLLFDRLRAQPAAALEQSQRRSLGSLDELLRGSANWAESKVKGSHLSPAEGRSLTDDFARYDIVKKVKRDLGDQELEKWTRKAAQVVKRLEKGGYANLDQRDRQWIEVELEPFLDQLAQIDGLIEVEESELHSQDIAAA